MRADLHTHSSCSDGTDSPRDVVRAAAAAGLDVIALTDHDSTGGWDQARATAGEVGIGFVPGVEISCELGGRGVHLLAYGVDPAHRGLAAELGRVLSGRRQRLPAVLDRLRGVGVDVTEEQVRAVSGQAVALGRPHVADALVAGGVVADRAEAFERYLMPGRPAYVPRYGAPLREAIGLVGGAGGVAVVAHPWARGSRRALTETVVAELAGLGLTGLEVWHHDHSTADSARLSALARDLGQVRTGSSDHHGRGKIDHDLGSHTTPVGELERLLDAMNDAAGRARAADPALQPAAADLR